MSEKKNSMQMIAGLDIGNGYVKGFASTDGNKGSGIDFLSGVALKTSDDDVKVKLSQADYIVDDIFNEMAVTFDTPIVESKTMRLFGLRAAVSGNSMDEFDVTSHQTKAHQELSSILVLGSIAGKALQEYYGKYKSAPEDGIINVNARIALALPISEYKTYRKEYAEKFKGVVHKVTIHNFDVPVTVCITISDVQVMAEGASAQFAITDKGVELMEMMLADLRSRGEKLEGVTASDIYNAKNTLGVDIGEGTVNFPVFQNGRFNPDASVSFFKGYGTVLDAVRHRLAQKNLVFASRKALVESFLAGPMPTKPWQFNIMQEVLQSVLEGFANEVQSEFRKILTKIGVFTEVIYVYGGGANALKEYLYPKLIQVGKSVTPGGVGFPILYLDSAYSRYLNREGLYSIAKRIAEME